MSARAEITWSLLHPRKPDPAYLREVIAAARDYQVDSFELCGEAHRATGSMDGAIHFRDYPSVTGKLDHAAIDTTVRALRECIELSHASGRPVYYWHREVMVPRAVVESVPGLLNENGEFDLLGAAYHALLGSKLREFFDLVPQLDGLVLTLTESDYSVIHNSNPRRYPPVDVVKAVITTFADELNRRGKRFVLRSFGSIAQDYDDILAGAAAVDGRFDFEIETKITPYDFTPFLPLNPYLRRTGRARLSAEYDSIGEFLGAGYLPAPDPVRVVECVRYAQRQQVDRHVIRVDRIGHATFTSAQAINLHAFDRAIRDQDVTAPRIWCEWARRHWPACAPEMTAAMRRGIELVKQTHFIDGHVIFHAFPIDPTMKWIKAAGILAVFTPDASLRRHDGMWGILSEMNSPERSTLLAEKDAAVALADAGLREVRALRARLPEAEFLVSEYAWLNATTVTRLIRAWCRCVVAYREDLESAQADHPMLSAAIADARADFAAVIDLARAEPKGAAGPVHAAPEGEYGGRERGDSGIGDAYARPLWEIVQSLVPEFEGEWAERAAWQSRRGLIDFVVCGGIADDYRVRRYMHATHARLIDGRPARAAGNRVFPNGFLEVELAAPRDSAFRLVVTGDPGASRGFRLTINRASRDASYGADGIYEERLSMSPADESITVRIQKNGADYPWIFGVATIAESDQTES